MEANNSHKNDSRAGENAVQRDLKSSIYSGDQKEA